VSHDDVGTRLAEQQRLFLRAVMHPTGVADFLAEADAATRAAFSSAFVDAGDLDAVARMDIYAESYFWRLHDVLVEEFEVTAWLIGESRFRNLATDYVLRRPSRHYDLHRYGDPFPEFIAGHPLEGAWPGLAALAEVELAIARALHVGDEEPLEAGSMASFDPLQWPALRFVLARSVWIGSGPLPYPQLLAAARKGEPAPAPEALTAGAAATHTLVWRADGRVFHRAVDPGEAAGIRALSEGAHFDELCAGAAEESPYQDGTPDSSLQRVVGRLHAWFARGMIVRVERPERRD
jgi:hypothetical protein